MKMADGNPGAISVMAEMMRDGAKIDPDSFLGPMGGILALDSHGIYGPRIWMDSWRRDYLKAQKRRGNGRYW
jgi:hypothetical protein